MAITKSNKHELSLDYDKPNVDMLNTKVVDNFLIMLFLKFNDFRPDGLGVIDFRILLSGFACPLNRSE